MVFTPDSAQHALSATLVLEEMTNLPSDLVGARVELAVQPPDHFLMRGPIPPSVLAETTGTAVPIAATARLWTVCRADQQIWITPGSLVKSWLQPFLAEAGEPPKSKKKSNLGPIGLPVPAKEIALLPILLQARDAGTENGLHLLDVQLMPPLARSLHVDDWSARAGFDASGHLARLELSRPGWHVIVRVENLLFGRDFAAAVWAPQSPDLLRLSAAEAKQWFDAIGDALASGTRKEP